MDTQCCDLRCVVLDDARGSGGDQSLSLVMFHFVTGFVSLRVAPLTNVAFRRHQST